MPFGNILDRTDFRPDVRRMRAMQLSSEVMRTIDGFIRDGRFGDDDRDCRKHAARALFELFYAGGWEVITDQMRTEAGLPLRDDKGWTPQEAAIMEDRRLEAMLRPTSQVLAKDAR